jgi:hypothetical protein
VIDGGQRVQILTGEPARYSVVRQFRSDGRRCTLFLEAPAVGLAQVQVAVQPDQRAADTLRELGLRAMSVTLEIDPTGGLSCSALFRSAAGPTRLPVSESVAMALCSDGRRTVVTHREGGAS